MLKKYDLMKEVMKYRKVDAHNHDSYPNPNPAGLIDKADRLGIDVMAISRPVHGDLGPEEFRPRNDMILNDMKLYPGRFIGQLTLNAMYQKESLEEIDRCLDLGMAMVKVHNGVKISDPLFYPIIEKCIEFKMPILVHQEAELGVGGLRMKYEFGRHKPNISIPEDFVEVARRYPEVMLQLAHITSGDWEYMCKTIWPFPNLYVDVSGSSNGEGVIDFALKYLGEDRIFFGSDRAFEQGVGKVLTANLNERQRRKIFFDNFTNVLRKGGRNVD